jgi:hypothetical protein
VVWVAPQHGPQPQRRLLPMAQPQVGLGFAEAFPELVAFVKQAGVGRSGPEGPF